MQQILPETRAIKARYLTTEHRIMLDVEETIADIRRTGDTVTAVLADGTSVDYDVEEGVTVLAGDTDLRQLLAAELHRIADDIVRLELPLKDTLCSSLNLGVLDSRDDLERWAEYLGSSIEVDPANGIPFTLHRILLDGREYGAWLDVQAQTRPEPQESELARLRAEVAELRAAQGGEAR
ncbi:hypothetical protein ABZ793_06015 [Micromonospora sp. NPDC047465]|uniref:hypothetical protein n=1 Tax=Micromonospora sp. NPDC047465 TaxID=3154813 RepID=UPI0033C564E6